MVSVQNVFEVLNDFAPVSTKMDFDNVGLLVGHRNRKVSKILVALDVTDEVIEEAIAAKADLIVAHHPIFFELKSVSDDTLIGRKILRLAENGISALCMHTNLDAAAGGVNDALAEKLSLRGTQLLNTDGVIEDGTPYGIGRVGELDKEKSFADFLTFTKDALNANGLRYVDGGKPVKKVGVLGGSGGSEIAVAIAAGCDTFVTGDTKYHQFMEAKEAGLNYIDAGHFCTENVVVPVLAEKIRKAFSEVSVFLSEKHKQTEKFL